MADNFPLPPGAKLVQVNPQETANAGFSLPAGAKLVQGGSTPPPQQRTVWDSLSDAGNSFWEGVGGKAVTDIMMGASRNPEAAQKAKDTMKALVEGIRAEPGRVWQELSETGRSMLHGDLPGMAYHAAGSVPLVGKPADQVADDVANGDYAKGFGHALGLLLPFAAGALPKDITVRPVKPTANAVTADAVAFADRNNIPISMGVRTGNRAVGAVEGFIRNDVGGAGYAKDAQAATTDALKTTGDQLADRTHPTPVTPEGAGKGVVLDLQNKISDLDQQADASYKEFRKAEQYPQNIRTIQTGVDQNGRPVLEDMAMPVDMRPVKDALRPIYQKYQRAMPVAEQRASIGLKAIENIMNEGNFKPATIAEMDLSAIKQAARSEMPELRDVSSGLASKAMMDLDGAIRGTVQGAYWPGYGGTATGAPNPALKALIDGRQLTADKWNVADTLKSFGRKIDDLEPVQVYNQLTWGKDAGVQRLRDVAQNAPNAIPAVGRAYVEGLLDTATREGDFAKARTVFNNWDKLGDESKSILFRDPKLVKDLDDFFTLAKRATDNPNPSGTAYVSNAGSHIATILPGVGLLVYNPGAGGAVLGAEAARVIGTSALARMLFNPETARALTNGMKIPLRSPAAATAASQLLKLAGNDAKPADQQQ